jgi:hypothetical protein
LPRKYGYTCACQFQVIAACSGVATASTNRGWSTRPCHGDHQEDGTGISQLLQQGLFGGAISAGILLRSNINLADAVTCHQAHLGHNPTFIAAGFTGQKGLAGYLHDTLPQTQHVFIEDHANTLYRKHSRAVPAS